MFSEKIAGKIIILVLLCTLFFPMPLSGASGERNVVLISVDRLSFLGLMDKGEEYLHINTLLNQGSLALMNTATGGGLNSENAYMSIGTGTRALAGQDALLSLEVTENYLGDTGVDLYQRHYGRELLEGEVVFLDLADTRKRNETRSYTVVPGALGEALEGAGGGRVILGNADTHVLRRFAPLILTDTLGQVGDGVISDAILIRDPSFPYGRRIDEKEMARLFSHYYPQNQMIVVEWGDFYRLDEYASHLTQERHEELLRANLANLNNFLGHVLEAKTKETLLIFVSPSPPKGDWRTGRMMTPVVMLKENLQGELLLSETTRRPGIIANIDIGPTILQHLGVAKPAFMLGEPVTASPSSDAHSFLTSRFLEIERVFNQRAPVIQVYITLQVVVVLAALGGILFVFPWAVVFRPFMLSLLSVPFVLLLLPLLPIVPLPVTLVVIFGSSLLVGTVLFFAFPFRTSMLLMGLVTSMSLILDVSLNSPLMKRSFLGYDPVAGARYYGIGNEYMGVLIGSTLLFSAVLLQFYPRLRRFTWPMVILYYLGVVYYMAAPALGANFGGTLTVLTAGLVATITFHWPKKAYGLILLGGAGALVLFILLLWLNLPGEGRTISHWGRSMTAIAEGGGEEVFNILTRKATMSLRLLRYSLWSRVFLVFLLAQGVLLFRPLGVLKELRQKQPLIMGGIMGSTAGSATAVVTNDSGVVAAATLLLFSSLPLLYLVLEKVNGVLLE